MTSILRQPATWRISTAVVIASLTITLAEAGGPFRNPLRTKTSVEQLAEKIDKLERDLQHSGRVTVKAPDVWGQARLTAHREEFERQMAAQLEAFKETTNAQIAVTDQSFLQQALALAAATQGTTLTPPDATKFGTVTTISSTPTVGGNTTAIVQSSPINLFNQTTGVGAATISLEPEILLDQRKRFLDHLHEIRRINEGDDSADSPGYSLNLVRVPVSVVPGDKTRENFGVEVTLSAEPVVTDELLPTTFRELVINDLVDQLALPVVKVIDLAWEHLLGEEQNLRAIDENDVSQARKEIEIIQASIDKLRTVAECLSNRVPAKNTSSKPRTLEDEVRQLLKECNYDQPGILAIAGLSIEPSFSEKLAFKFGQGVAQNAVSRTSEAATPALAPELGTAPVVNPARPEPMDWEIRFGKALKDELSKQPPPQIPPSPENEQGLRLDFGPSPSRTVFPASATKPLSLPSVQETAVNSVKEAAKKALDAAEKGLEDRRGTATMSLQRAISRVAVSTTMPTPRDRRSRYAIPPSQVFAFYGEKEFAELVRGVFRSRDSYQRRDRMQLTEVQSYLRNELEAAYDSLTALGRLQVSSNPLPGKPEMPWQPFDIWTSPIFPAAADLRHLPLLEARRDQYKKSLPYCGIRQHCPSEHVGQTESQNHPYAVEQDDLLRLSRYSATSRQAESATPSERNIVDSMGLTQSLGWAILVESSLLNQHLNDDLKQISLDPNCECLAGIVNDPCPYQFYGPNPSPEARQAFVQYVKCRWPIRVFALDPVIQQQNVADVFSLRRESQLAVALAFSKGLVNTQSLTRHMRRIEQDMRSISLNNTHVAFGAGDDTFGWRFFPRFQTLDVESNAKTIVRDHILGGPSRDLRVKNWRIEPGMRECVALVVMPSFIKHVRFDVRTNWFHLVPGSLETAFKQPAYGPTMEATVGWSETVRSIEDSVVMCIKDEHKYRVGEVDRLVKRAKQISQQLPLNTMYAQVPYENTLGGFEMFSSGVTDLAPELVGFYGSPGVDLERDTTVFLVGDNFSVHSTHVIAGNQPLEFRMLSREVMQVTIPRNVRVDRRLCEPRTEHKACQDSDATDLYVEVRLATPYGVSSPLHIPVVALNGLPAPKPADPPKPAELSWGSTSYEAAYQPKFNSATQKVTVDLASIKAKPPHLFSLVTTSDRPLAVKTAGKVQLRVTGVELTGNAIPIPVEPGVILTTLSVTTTDKRAQAGPGVNLDGDNFKGVHTAMANLVAGLLNGQAPDSWPASFNLKLQAQFSTDEFKTVVETRNVLEVTIRINR